MGGLNVESLRQGMVRPNGAGVGEASGSVTSSSAGSNQVLKLRWVITSAPYVSRMRPAPPKWSGWECVTTTVCTFLGL